MTCDWLALAVQACCTPLSSIEPLALSSLRRSTQSCLTLHTCAAATQQWTPRSKRKSASTVLG